jgi:hypothetical protein
MIIEEGSRVRATNQVTEDGGEADPNAEPLGPGWVHAEAGDEGSVLHIEQARSLEEGLEDTAAITVQFDRTGTVCTVFIEEVEPVKDTNARTTEKQTTTKHNELPECGILPDDAFDTPDEWREAMMDRQDKLFEQTMRILGEYNDAFDVAEQLNRLYAPFNTYDRRGDVTNHLVVVPKGTETLHIQFHDGELDYDAPMDHRVLEHQAEVWWFDDAELPDDYESDDLHEVAVLQCLGLVWWGNDDMIHGAVIGEEWEAYANDREETSNEES